METQLLGNFTKEPRVALVSGFWAQNIGNAYFNIGGKWILDQVFGKDEVQFIQDMPPYRTFYNQSKGNPKNYAELVHHLDVEYIVLQGPCLTKTFADIWGDAFKIFKASGIKVMLIGCAFFKYTDEEINSVRSFLDKYPPHLISTRDSETYKVIKDWIPNTHDGIDSAFFVPKAFNPLRFKFDPFYTFTFDRFPEPDIQLSVESAVKGNIPLDSLVKEFNFDGNKWELKSPSTQYFFSKLGKAQAYFGHLIDRRKLPSELNEHTVIRPEHRYTPHMTHKIYQHPNSFVSDETFTYFSIYAGTSLTLSDRVHACVMSLAYGNPAMLFTISPRQALFSRLGLEEIRLKPVTLDLDFLEEQRQAELSFIKSHI